MHTSSLPAWEILVGLFKFRFCGIVTARIARTNLKKDSEFWHAWTLEKLTQRARPDCLQKFPQYISNPARAGNLLVGIFRKRL